MDTFLQMSSAGQAYVCRPAADFFGRHGGHSRALARQTAMQRTQYTAGWCRNVFAVDTRLARQQLSAMLLAGPSGALQAG